MPDEIHPPGLSQSPVCPPHSHLVWLFVNRAQEIVNFALLFFAYFASLRLNFLVFSIGSCQSTQTQRIFGSRWGGRRAAFRERQYLCGGMHRNSLPDGFLRGTPRSRCREIISDLHPGNLASEGMVSEGVIITLRELLPYDWRKTANLAGY